MQETGDELSQLWAQAREWERRTFSNVAVTDPTSGVRLLEVAPVSTAPAKSQITIRDNAGHAILQNDINAGWGLSSPQNGYPAYPLWPAMQTASTSFAELWTFFGFIYSPSVEWAYVAGTEFMDTFAECRLEWSFEAAGPWTVVANSTFQSNEDVSNSASTFTVRSGAFTFPIVASGQHGLVRLMCRKASGPGTKAFCSPVYLNAL